MMNTQQAAVIDTLFFDAVAELGKLLGLSKSASLALAVLFTEGRPLSLDEVANKTKIAKSSMSVILKSLEQMGLVEVAGKLHDRRKFYKISDNLGDAVALAIARRLDHFVGWEQRLQDAQSASQSGNAKQIAELTAIYETLTKLAVFFRTRRADAWQDIQECLADDNPGT